MIRFTLILLPAVLAGCVTLPTPLPGPGAGVRCNADRVQPLVGREAKPQVVARAKQRSGARLVRLIKPDMAVTMDFRSDRLNLELDNVNTIKAARCG
ncbi:I78 family peptidase inhibitor [Sphingomonas sp. LT1P40]|uniref:I78 family peptidase inhibitor n=1 Tax=Alteristakelama amylovorans TaxID=3096166 RepID=UPI002FC63ACA